MSKPVKRLRMFAGPNGSGKSTLYHWLVDQRYFSPPAYVNADDLGRELLSGGIAFQSFGLQLTRKKLCETLLAAGRIQPTHPFLKACSVRDSVLTAPVEVCGDYVAACIADFLHEELLSNGLSFAFETVMSHPSKVNLFARARAADYRTYLYFVATTSAEVNQDRVQERVAKGGHDVPADKIVERYDRSLHLVRSAITQASRAFIFDNSGPQHIWLAEFDSEGRCSLQVPSEELPKWFHAWVE